MIYIKELHEYPYIGLTSNLQRSIINLIFDGGANNGDCESSRH